MHDTGQRIMIAFPKKVTSELEAVWREKYKNLLRGEREHIKSQKGKV